MCISTYLWYWKPGTFGWLEDGLSWCWTSTRPPSVTPAGTGDPWNVVTELFPEDMPVKRTCQKSKSEFYITKLIIWQKCFLKWNRVCFPSFLFPLRVKLFNSWTFKRSYSWIKNKQSRQWKKKKKKNKVVFHRRILNKHELQISPFTNTDTEFHSSCKFCKTVIHEFHKYNTEVTIITNLKWPSLENRTKRQSWWWKGRIQR